MNSWFDDPRAKQAELDAFDAERAERRGAFADAHVLYANAARAFASVALSVPPDHPNTRGALAVAALASALRSGNLGEACDLVARFLAEPDALGASSRIELLAMEQSLGKRLQSRPAGASSFSPRRDQIVRSSVRNSFRVAA